MNILKLRIFEIEFYYLHSHKIRIDKKKLSLNKKKLSNTSTIFLL